MYIQMMDLWTQRREVLKEYEWGDENHSMPRGIYVKFDNPSIGRLLRNPANHQYRESILIRPQS